MQDRFTPVRIWRSMDPALRLRAAASFWRSEALKRSDVEAAASLLAQSLHFRPQSVRSAPLAKRAAWLAGNKAIPGQIASGILFAYHMEHQVPMMSHLLDALGIAHEAGRITGETKGQNREQVEQAVGALFASFDERDVITYLETLVSQDGETWGALADLLMHRGSR